jgi:hypothetical protein
MARHEVADAVDHARHVGVNQVAALRLRSRPSRS